ASALASTAACTTGGEGPGWWPAASELTPMERPRPALAMRVALSLPVESGDGTVARDRLIADEPAVPDIAGRWTGVWSGLGVMTRRVSTEIGRASCRERGEIVGVGGWCKREGDRV